MSKLAQAAAKASVWLEQYLALGEERSIHKLAVNVRRICGENGWEYAPAERTLESWSARYGWDRLAKQHDAEVMEKARAQLLKKRADLAETRVTIALDHCEAFHALVRDALTVETPVMDENGKPTITVHANGSFTPNVDRRPATFRDLDRHDIAAIIALHNAAVSTERMLLTGASSPRQDTESQGRDDGAVIRVLGPEALAEMAIKVGSLVQTLAETTERRKAEKAQAIIPHDRDEEAYLLADGEYDPGGPGRH